MQQLTERQEQVLDCIKRHLHEHQLPATRNKIAEHLGLEDASRITGHLEKLAQGGRLQLLPNKKRGIHRANGQCMAVKVRLPGP